MKDHDASGSVCNAGSRERELLAPGRLWGLLDMLRVYAEEYIELGRLIEEAQTIFSFAESYLPSEPERALRDEEKARLQLAINKMLHQCKKVNLSVSSTLIERCVKSLPATGREFELLAESVRAEIFDKKFFYVEDERAKYHDLYLPSIINTAFPLASKELVMAGNCFAAGMATACVFHSMRAAEIGVRALARALNVSFPDKPLELAEWQNILDQADSKVLAMKNLPRGSHKDEELGFYSQAAVQFRYFKDAWRVRVAHARETYEDMQARRIFDHTLEFFEVLSKRLKE